MLVNTRALKQLPIQRPMQDDRIRRIAKPTEPNRRLLYSRRTRGELASLSLEESGPIAVIGIEALY